MHKIIAPFDGWCAPLDEVPDEVFAGRMLGDGLAIDPTSGVVLAPCDGEIVTLPQSAHAVSIRGSDGLEVLIHIGIDTVRLAGCGFDARVKPGARVQSGDELIRFDLDLVARGAKSLMTPIVVTSDGAVVTNRRTSGAVRAGELLFQVDCGASPAATLQAVRVVRRIRDARGARHRGRLVAGPACSAGGAAGATRQRHGHLDHAPSARSDDRCA